METIQDQDFPGLYQCADASSMEAQSKYFIMLAAYSVLLIIASLFTFFGTTSDPWLKIISAFLFLISLGLMVWQKMSKPEDLWYNGRAVAESVKTRAWRFMMKATPYEDYDETASKIFIHDVKEILQLNESFFAKVGIKEAVKEPISQKMMDVRHMTISNRFHFYCKKRIEHQENWYIKKAVYNSRMSNCFFVISIVLHVLAIILLLYNIKEPLTRFPVSVIGVMASAVLGWIQAKKYSELFSSYSLTAHEISIIKSDTTSASNENQLSDYVLSCEAAFSREHTQWIARKRR
jgi:hypothetical protein